MIAYSFPPAGGGRVMRSMKFVKYLAQFSWEPIVLTVKKPIVSHYDTALVSEIPDSVKITRTPSLEFDWKRILFKKDLTKGSPHTGAKKKATQPFLQRIARRLKWWFFFPDSRSGWIPFCVFSGYRLIKKEAIDVIYVSAEPFSAFISGVLLKKLTHKPLVLDFRDEWVGFSKEYFPDKPNFIVKLERIVEAWFVRNADRVISVTEPIILEFHRRYPNENKEKFACITNGFDPEDFYNKETAWIPHEIFTIVYAGSLYDNRTPADFLKALNQCLSTEPNFFSQIKLRFLGEISPNIINQTRMLSTDKLSIEISGFLPHQKALETMAQSDLLLYIEDRNPVSARILPAKLFEYLALRIPILALAEEGEVKKVIEQSETGVVFSSHDTDSICAYLLSSVRNFKKNTQHPLPKKEEYLQRFSRINTTMQLTKHFSQITNI